MYVFEVTLTPHSGTPAEPAEEAIDFLLDTWRKNGQILGTEFPLVRTDEGLRSVVRGPAVDALDEAHDNVYAQNWRLRALDLGTLAIRLVGPDALAAPVCPGHGGSELILYTHFASVESPLRCAECFGTVPLYDFPPRNDHSHFDLVTWQADYRACDRLQVGCKTGEAFALNEMENPASSLSRRGLEICAGIQQTTGLRTWYYLYRYRGVDEKSEEARPCPNCGGEWRLPEQWHGLFDFRCERCGLLSNIAHVLDADDDAPGLADANESGGA